MKARLLTVSALGGLISPGLAEAENFWTRDTLTGDWGGFRTQLAENGLTTEVSLTGYYADLISGGGTRTNGDFGGRLDAFFHLDTGKLGLWEGGGVHVHLEDRFGQAADRPLPRSGGLWPVNSGTAAPLGEPDRLVATSIYYTQAFSTNTVLMLGKINAFDLLASDPFFGGWGRDRFENIAFVAPPSGVVPPVIMGGVLVQKMDPFSFTLMVFDPNDRTNDYWVDELFHDGVNISLGATWSGEIAGRTSSIGITGTYSTKDGADLSSLLLPPGLTTSDKDGAFNVAINFSHLLVECDPGKGLGIYGKAAIADGNPNPIQASLHAGIAGHGSVPGRPDDVFGIGYYYYDLSDDLQDSLGAIVDINNEQGIELYYNLAVTPWLRVTADLQWIDPANGAYDDAWIGGLRSTIFF